MRDSHQKEARTATAVLGARDPRSLFFFFLSRLAPARDRTRLPFCGVAAISRRRGGRALGEGRPLLAGAGEVGRRRRPGSPPASCRAGEWVSFVLRLWAGSCGLGLSRGPPEVRWLRAACEPPKSRREACAGPGSFPPS